MTLSQPPKRAPPRPASPDPDSPAAGGGGGPLEGLRMGSLSARSFIGAMRRRRSTAEGIAGGGGGGSGSMSGGGGKALNKCISSPGDGGGADSGEFFGGTGRTDMRMGWDMQKQAGAWLRPPFGPHPRA